MSRLSQTKPRLEDNRSRNSVGIEIRQVGGQEFDRLIDVDQPARFAVERRHAHVGRQHFAVAVEDIGTRRGDRVAADDAMRGAAVGREPKTTAARR